MTVEISPWALAALAALIAWLVHRARRSRYVELPAARFWSVVRSQPAPVVLMTLKGWISKSPCYAFPYNGIVFTTPAAGTECPDGVRLVRATDQLSVP